MSKRSLPQQELTAADAELMAESHLPSIALSIRHHLLKGDMDHLPAVQSRVVRVYISSHFYGRLLSLMHTQSSSGITNQLGSRYLVTH